MVAAGVLSGFGARLGPEPGALGVSAISEQASDIVVVKSCHIPRWFPGYMHFAHHTWIDIKLGSEDRWVRVEIAEVENGGVAYEIAAKHARANLRWENRVVNVLGLLEGKAAKSAAESILKKARTRGPFYKTGYVAVPGPNSNTFIRELTRDSTALSFLFHHNALGKDYAPGLWLEWAPSRTGWTLTCPFGGCTVALKEGVQIHVMGFSIGHLGFPPRVQLPFVR